MKSISVKEFCLHYNIPVTFIDSLSHYELIDIVKQNSKEYILVEDIQYLEKLMRLHYTLEINMEGIDVINRLLKQIERLQHENELLKSRNSPLDFL